MSTIVFTILLAVGGAWLVSDGWHSIAIYLKKPDQNWHDHLIRAIRSAWGLLFIYMAYLFAIYMFGAPFQSGGYG